MDMQLETERLILRNYCKNDLTNMHKLRSEPAVWTYSSKEPTNHIEESGICLDGVL